MNVTGRRALVTGGAGTIGSHVVDQLVARGAEEIVVLDNFVRGRWENLARALESGRVRVIDGDIRDVATVRAATSGSIAGRSEWRPWSPYPVIALRLPGPETWSFTLEFYNA